MRSTLLKRVSDGDEEEEMKVFCMSLFSFSQCKQKAERKREIFRYSFSY